jgi:hypothetical protein
LDHTAGIPPHGELEQIAEAGHIEWGIWLYRCQRCGSCWEFEAWTYFPDRSSLRRVLPVASLEQWAGKQRRRMKPRSILVGGSMVFGRVILPGRSRWSRVVSHDPVFV